ncbi:MAG TPA: Ku protein [Vicinamibacteria bacterium]|nr:Ku protein [Vicinamibacteria bacterium]
MARAIWSGAISFGLVHVPVELYGATESREVRFHQFEKGTGQRVRYKRVGGETDEEVPWEKIEKGYEIAEGEFVVVTSEELESLAPAKSRTIKIEEFVDLADIDPIAWQQTYYLGPSEAVASAEPYALLHRAMVETKKVGIGRFVLRSKEHLATVRPIGRVLGLSTMYFADEIRSPESVVNLPSGISLSEKEVQMAGQLISALSAKLDLTKFKDTYREQVLELIQKKARGERIVTEPAAVEARVIDLMSALKSSLESVGAGAALTSLTRSELLARAARADISGRSKMSKEDLIRALEDKAS